MSILKTALLLSLLFLSGAAYSRSYSFSSYEFIGLDRSQESWLLEYLELKFPCSLSDLEIKKLEEKLLNSQVFQSAKVYPKVNPSKKFNLAIKVKEKWTTIPVIRGAIGGGTPLLVAGIYDTHSFGRLWTLGGEFRKYGEAPAGGVIWARAPRWMGGDYYLNFELWKDNRLRNIYDNKFNRIASIDSRATMVNIELRMPVGINNFNLGLLWSSRAQEPTTIAQETGFSLVEKNQFSINTGSNTLNKGLVRLVYDNISVNNIHYHGHRASFSAGPIFYGGVVKSIYELEYFYYHYFERDWNFAFHSLFGSASDSSLQNQRFLGGFESIRGIPDGALFGRHAAYSNAELRHFSFKFPKLWIQSVIFADSGFATNEEEWRKEPWTSTAGIGLRFSVPQVHRLMFRIDYAWSIDGSQAQGITAGMNQFFQPYKPL